MQVFYKHTKNDKGNQNIPKAIALIILGLSVTASKSSMVRFVKKVSYFFHFLYMYVVLF